VRGALDRDDAEGALAKLVSLGRLAPVAKEDALAVEAQRLSFAQHNGMVHVGKVFIDRYEHPNRAGALPTVDVDWADAVKLCETAGKHLCSEQEWEQACRGALGATYPWGAELEKGRCVVKDKKTKRAAAAGAKAKCVGPAGVFDLVGNVAEWTSSPLKEDAPQRVTRGGSFAQGDAKLTCEARDYVLPGLGGAKHLGLRCCL
jgi:formylglycine-generating enzyme required for sulfatase activity